MAEEPLLEDVMRTPVVTMAPMETVRRAAEEMSSRGIGSIVIVDSRDMLLGIVTKTDIVAKVVARGLDPGMVKLGDIMTENPYYMFSDAPLREAAELMGSKGIGHLPVLDPETRRIVGIITKSDILKIAPHYIDLVYTLRAG
ncbi:MAG: CBS domain-containing protein [Desulfurococcales archaeon]|nr:CBS domain-containing protein [Desulfurococcales archaeon]